jgi:hypothetical protein
MSMFTQATPDSGTQEFSLEFGGQAGSTQRAVFSALGFSSDRALKKKIPTNHFQGIKKEPAGMNKLGTTQHALQTGLSFNG